MAAKPAHGAAFSRGRQDFLSFLNTLITDLAHLSEHNRIAALKRGAFDSLLNTLEAVIRDARFYGMPRVAFGASVLDYCIRDFTDREGDLLNCLELTRSFDEFMTTIRRRVASSQGGLPAVIRADGMALVLVIDDEMWVHGFVRRSLSATMIVEGVNNGVDAVEWLKHQTPDLILLDVQLPDLRGTKLLRLIKAMPGLSAVPVIMFSNDNDDDTVVSALVGGAIDYISKSKSGSELLTRVTNTLATGLPQQYNN